MSPDASGALPRKRSAQREAALEDRLTEIGAEAARAFDGIRAVKKCIEAFQEKPHGVEMDAALNVIEWLVDKLHMDIDRIGDLTDTVAEPLHDAEEEAAASFSASLAGT